MPLLKSISIVNIRRIPGKRECFSRFPLRTQTKCSRISVWRTWFSQGTSFDVGHLSSSTTRAFAVFSARVSTALLTEPLDFLNFGRYVNTPGNNRKQPWTPGYAVLLHRFLPPPRNPRAYLRPILLISLTLSANKTARINSLIRPYARASHNECLGAFRAHHFTGGVGVHRARCNSCAMTMYVGRLWRCYTKARAFKHVPLFDASLRQLNSLSLTYC